ncbi:MAG: aminopeptidase [Acidiferrobacterales bacterium]|nr:aminopeptidase [Acidiferrobacterales bacterium]
MSSSSILSRILIIFFLLCTIAISGCSRTSYYYQAAKGQLSLLNKRVPVKQLVQNPGTPEDLRQRLLLADRMRQFALKQLQLENNSGFTSYADIGRPYVTWNVVAAPAYSLTPETWCFPIAGCVSYKGYFKKSDAEKFEKKLLSEGKDTLLYGVSAYSTLGWFADPLLNTFINYQENDLAALIFHELAHQVVYVKDDSDFNEAFATAVETILLEKWLNLQGNQSVIHARALQQKKQNRITELVLQYREHLRAAYSGSSPEKDKPRIFSELKQKYQELKQQGKGTRYYDWWFSRPLDNADLLTISTYYQLVPDFLKLYENSDSDLSEFINKIRDLARIERDKRRRLLTSQV